MTFSGEQAVDTRDDASTPDVFVARQPIMRADSTVVGYELLYRSIAEPDLVIQNPRAATGHVLATPLFSIGLDRLVGDARAWINFPRSWLVEGVIGALPANRVVLEVLESVPVDDELVATCRLLREQGFTLALDGYMPNDPRYPLLPIVDYAKVDLGIVETAQWPSMIHLLRANHTIPIALKVEDWLHLDRALNNGFELFQGYYLTRPNIVPGKEVPVLDSTRLLALKVAASEESTLEDVEHIVETDAGLAFRLLRYLNAAAFGFRDPVSTVHQAVVRLGDHGARTWLLIATIHALGKGRPLELIAVSAIRARLSEQLAIVSGRHGLRDEAFMTGLFLNIDAITGMTMDDALDSISLPDSVVAALTGEPSGDLGTVIELASAYESGVWDRVEALSASLGVDKNIVSNEYLDAVDWARRAITV